MTARDERLLLRAVASERDGAWLCHVRRRIPKASAVRVLVGLQALVRDGLVREDVGAYQMATFSLTAEGKVRLWRGRPRERLRAVA